MSHYVGIRLKSEAAEYFKNRMNEWHLNTTETLHRLISEHEALGKEKRSLTHDLDVMRQLINERPTQTEKEKKRASGNMFSRCLRNLSFPIEQKGFFCKNCRENHFKEFEACEKLESL